jgi:two-component system CheB/CheR fusion protein
MAAELVSPESADVYPNQVYVMPPGYEMTWKNGLTVHPRPKTRGFSNVFTVFLNSLSENKCPPGVAIILSGLDDDGAGALRTFREKGGVVLAQSPSTAEFHGMPTAAIATGAVHHVLRPEEIAPELVRILAGLQDASSAAAPH